MNSRQKYMLAISLLCFIAFFVTGYLIYMHYSGNDSICDINKTFSCSVVNTSSYSEIMGIPIAILGLLSYIAIFVLALRVMHAKPLRSKLNKHHLIEFIFFIALFGTIFQFYLLIIETFVLNAYCIFCLFSEGLITGIFLLTSSQIYRTIKKRLCPKSF